MRNLLIAALGLLVASAAAPVAHAQDGPKVVTSILPVHSLVSSVMEGVGTPDLLVPGGASPHSFALRPSDARKLQQSQLVFWVGPSLETFLERPLDALPKNAEIVALENTDGLIKLPYREGGPWEGHDDHGHADKHDHGDKHAHADKHDHGDKHAHADKHDHGDKHGHGDAHAHGETDAHLWLDPRNAIVFVNEIAEELAHVDPANKARYEANAAKTVAELQALDKQLAADLDAAKGKPYIVFHDAYQYFESRYGLTPAGSITVSPERSPGAKRLVEIRKRIRDDDAVCVFSEPQFEPKLVGTVVQGTDARTGTLDPLGQGIEPGPDAYAQLMRNLARDLNACIAGSS